MSAIVYTMNLAGVFKHYPDSGPGSMIMCVLLDGGTLVTLGHNGGTACVVVMTLERYWKIVHAIHHRKYYRNWMLYVGLFLPWLNGVAVHMFPAIGTTRIVNGRCMPGAFWPSPHMIKVRSNVSQCMIR